MTEFQINIDILQTPNQTFKVGENEVKSIKVCVNYLFKGNQGKIIIEYQNDTREPKILYFDCHESEDGIKYNTLITSAYLYLYCSQEDSEKLFLDIFTE